MSAAPKNEYLLTVRFRVYALDDAAARRVASGMLDDMRGGPESVKLQRMKKDAPSEGIPFERTD
jgi:hypothetical protein